MESENKRPRGYGRSSSPDEGPTTSTGKRKTSESDGRSADKTKRSAPEQREIRNKNKFISIIRTRPHMLVRESTYDPSSPVSNGIESIELEVNYIRQSKQISGWNIHQYRVNIEPPTPLMGKRRFLVAQHKNTLNTYLFDGEQLFTNHRIHTESSSDMLELQSLDPRDNQMYTIQLKFTNIVQPNHERCLQIYNLIIRKMQNGLKMQLVGRHFYDPGNMIDLREHRLQLWPGYETSTRQFTGGLLLNIDVSHKVMRTDVVYDKMQEIYRQDENNFKRNFLSQIIGQTVLTAYNNKTYRIDDVDFATTCDSTFKRNDKDITYVQYYAEKYQLKIKHAHQPLLVVNPKDRDRRGGRNKLVHLVPELCRFTGYDDRQRNDIRLKNALKPYTQMNPRMRRERLLKFIQRIYETEKCTEVLNDWNLELEKKLVRVPAFKLPGRTIFFGDNNLYRVVSAGWDDAFRGNKKLYETIDLDNLAVVYPRSLERETGQFLQKLIELSEKMGFKIKEPIQKIAVSNEGAMVANFDELARRNTQMVLLITGSDNRRNGEWYGGIKKRSAQEGIPTQVVTKRVLQSPDGRLASIATKIAIQMNCKLGGLPWMPVIPMGGVMTVGFEIAKDSSHQKRYGCLVATMDLKVSTKTRFFSKVEEINGTDCSLQLTNSMISALKVYLEENEILPGRIIFYRGGAGEGDLPYIKETEVLILERRLRNLYKEKGQDLKLVYMVVTKKINTRFFLANSDRHIEPGTVVDKTITLDERYEFFMVSQQINQGTATPTNYNVIYESKEFPLIPEKLQLWTWTQTHLYYNWCGTTRVPAVLQYAIKLGFLVSNFIHRTPGDRMNNRLYFL